MMSEPGSNLDEMDDPWDDLRCRVDVTLHIVDLPPGLRGLCDVRTKTIWIAKGMRQRQRRAVLRHELVHLDRGEVFSNAHFRDREEAAVEQETARMMISLHALCDALRWTRDAYQLADELHVPVDLVALRMATMYHPRERAAVRAVLADVDELTAP